MASFGLCLQSGCIRALLSFLWAVVCFVLVTSSDHTWTCCLVVCLFFLKHSHILPILLQTSFLLDAWLRLSSMRLCRLRITNAYFVPPLCLLCLSPFVWAGQIFSSTSVWLNWGRWVQSGFGSKQWGCSVCLAGERCSCVKWPIAARGRRAAGECP